MGTPNELCFRREVDATNSDSMGEYECDESDLDDSLSEGQSGEFISKRKPADESISKESEESVPVFEITFRSEEVYYKLGQKVLQALQNALNSENLDSKYDLSCHYDSAKDSTVIQAFDIQTESSRIDPESGVGRERVASPGSSKESSPDLDISALFTIDTKRSSSCDVQCPSYKRGLEEILVDSADVCKKPKVEDGDTCRRPKTVSACFNCGSYDHSLRACPVRHNKDRIARAKRARLGKGVERYHTEPEGSFPLLQPGKLSKKLREALRLRQGEVPFYIYRMRIYGYPPGWFEEAKTTSSGISLFQSNADVIEASQKGKNEPDKIDVSQIIEYPGFNVHPGNDYRDDHKYFNTPALTSSFMKENLVKALGDNVLKSYTRKRHRPTDTSSLAPDESKPTISQTHITTEGIKETTSCNSLEPGEIEESSGSSVNYHTNNSYCNIESKQVHTQKEAAELHPTNSIGNNQRSESPTLADLQAQQERLLRELSASLPTEEDEESATTIYNGAAQANASSNQLDIIANLTEQQPNSVVTPSTPVTSRAAVREVIKDSQLGTPVLQFSPYCKLPCGDNFKVGVSDVINFENLPDSTGAYEKMRVVLDNVRKAIFEHESEEEKQKSENGNWDKPNQGDSSSNSSSKNT